MPETNQARTHTWDAWRILAFNCLNALIVIGMIASIAIHRHYQNVAMVAGTVGLVGPYGFQVLGENGQSNTISLAEGWSVMIAPPISQAELNRGDWVATSPIEVYGPDGSILVSQSFTTIERTARNFGATDLFEYGLLLSRGPDPESRSRFSVNGQILAFTNDMLWLKSRRSNPHVKLKPDAVGYKLHAGNRSDLKPGCFGVASASRDGTQQVLVIPKPMM